MLLSTTITHGTVLFAVLQSLTPCCQTSVSTMLECVAERCNATFVSLHAGLYIEAYSIHRFLPST